MSDDEPLIRRIYERFNARDIDAVLALLSDDVTWANGMDRTYVHGRDAVRAYWTHQWSVIDPHVEPLRISRLPDGSCLVDVHQTVRDLEGTLVLDEMVGHVFRIEGDRISRFDIHGPSQLSAVAHPE